MLIQVRCITDWTTLIAFALNEWDTAKWPDFC